MSHVKATDLPAYEPSDADLEAIANEDWETVEGSHERLLVEAGLLELCTRIAEAQLAPVTALPTRTPRSPEGRAAA